MAGSDGVEAGRSRLAVVLGWLWAGDRDDGVARLVQATPVTWLLIALIVVVWFASEVLPGRVGVRHVLGMSPFDVARGQWWRLFTPTLLNTPDASGTVRTTALEHLLFNLLPLVLVGPRVERVLGRVRYLGLWVVGEMLGRAWMAVLFPFDRSFQGGTSIFAVGALQAAALLDAVLHRRGSRAERWYLAAFVAVAVLEVIGAPASGRGNYNAHAAGAAAGIVLVLGWSRARVWGSVAALGLTASVAFALAGFHTLELHRTSPELQATIHVGRTPYYVAAGAGAVWVSNYGDGTVTRVDPATNRVVATVGLGGPFASGIAVAGGRVWVVDSPRSVAVIDPRVNRVVARVSVPRGASDVAFGSGSVWVGCTVANVIARIDPAQRRVVARIPVAPEPFELDADSSSVWVASYGSATLTRIDPVTNRATTKVGVEGWAHDVAIGSDAVWASGRVTERVSFDGRSVVKSASPTSDVFLLVADGAEAWGTRDNTVVRFRPDGQLVARVRVGVALTSGVTVADGSIWVTDVVGGNLLRVSR